MLQMIREIHEQPEVLKRIVAEEESNIAAISREIAARDIRLVIIAARGTSDNATTYAKYLFQCANGLPVAMAAPSVFTLYNAELKLANTLLIGVSQSGEAPDVIGILEEGRRLGAFTLAVTNEAGSAMTQVAERTILCRAGRELSVAATKTYTAELAVFYLLSSFLKGDMEASSRLVGLGPVMERLFLLEEDIRCKCERYRYMNECMVIGRGFNYATALETALKLKETCYVVAESYSAADLMHGPIALVSNGFPAIVLATSGKAYDNMCALSVDLRERGAETLVISDMPEALEGAATSFMVPTVEEPLSPLINILVSQIFAFYLSQTKGYNPDSPRMLTKVTKTR